MKRLINLMMVAMIVFGYACALADGIKVGVIHQDPKESGYYEANVRDMCSTFTVDNGYDAVFKATIDRDEQIKAIRDCIDDGVEYILISPVDGFGYDEALEEANKAGIKVILFGCKIDCDPRLYVAAVVSDMRKEGETAVAWLEFQCLEEYKILHIQEKAGSPVQIGRSSPLIEKCEAEANWSIVYGDIGGLACNSDEARDITEAAIEAGVEFNIVYAENDKMANGAMAALDAKGISHGLNGDVIIMSFDCNRWALEKLLAGEWNYEGQRSPFQAGVIDCMIKTLEAGGELEGLNEMKQIITEEIGFDAAFITQDVVDIYGL